MFLDEDGVLRRGVDEFFDAVAVDDVVAGEYNERLMDFAFGLQEGVPCAQLLVLDDEGDLDLVVVLEVLLDDFFLVADDADHIGDSCVLNGIEDMFEDRFVRDGKHDFGHGLCERSQPLPFTCCEHNRFLHHGSIAHQ